MVYTGYMIDREYTWSLHTVYTEYMVYAHTIYTQYRLYRHSTQYTCIHTYSIHSTHNLCFYLLVGFCHFGLSVVSLLINLIKPLV